MVPFSWQLLALAVSIALSFGAGWQTHAWKTDAELLSTLQRVQDKHKAMQDKTDDLEAKLEAKSQESKENTRVITKEVIKYANRPSITLPADFGLLFNSAATGIPTTAIEAPNPSGGVTDAAVLEVTADNFATCREWREVIIGWQKWYAGVVKP